MAHYLVSKQLNLTAPHFLMLSFCVLLADGYFLNSFIKRPVSPLNKKWKKLRSTRI